MELYLTPEQESRLKQLASLTGREVQQVLVTGVDRILEYDEHFLAAVEEGRIAVRQGDLLDHEEVVASIERLLQS